MFFLILTSTSISLMMMFLSHPISFSLLILIQTLSISMLCGLLTNLYWFSYLIFLIMIGGLLIIFLYMTNVASNEKFKPSKKVKMIFVSSIIFSMNYFFLENFFLLKQISFWNSNLLNMNLKIVLMKFYNYPFNMILIIMMIYLLITMIMTVKITDIKKGALRQKH